MTEDLIEGIWKDRETKEPSRRLRNIRILVANDRARQRWMREYIETERTRYGKDDEKTTIRALCRWKVAMNEQSITIRHCRTISRSSELPLNQLAMTVP
jgi:hypothetical protein